MKWIFIIIALIVYVMVSLIFIVNDMALHKKENVGIEHNGKIAEDDFTTDHVNDIVSPPLD